VDSALRIFAGASRRKGHLGLSLLQERVAEAGATISIISAPGGGTSIRLQLARS